MANLLVNISLILSLVLLAAALCPTKDGSWIELGSPLTSPSGTFDFDNLGFSVKTPWSYFDSPLLVYGVDSKNIYLSGFGGSVYNGVFQTSGGSTWDGKSAWSDNNGLPGYYFYINDVTSYLELSFNYTNPDTNPSAVAMRVQGDANTANNNYIIAYDANDNVIGCINTINEIGGLNKWYNIGLRTNTPIKRLKFQGVMTADNFQFADPVCLSDSCDTNAWCFNNAANDGVICTCKTGYEGDGSVGNCADKNECNTPAICADNASCDNLPGSYNCTCDEGFEGDGFTNCTDINECDIGLCSPNAICINYEPGFNCTCADGYEGDGITCTGTCHDITATVTNMNHTDKNECSSNPCDVNASCTNTEGSFSCECNDGYTGDGNSCTKVEVPVAAPVDAPITAGPIKAPAVKISSARALMNLEGLVAVLLACLLLFK